MHPGKRRDALQQAARGILYGDLELSGRPIGQSDAQIAAIARSHGYSLATRNVADFADCGIQIVNPWER